MIIWDLHLEAAINSKCDSVVTEKINFFDVDIFGHMSSIQKDFLEA